MDKTTTSDFYTETVRFTYVEEELYVEYSIANSIVTATVEGEQIPIPFGNRSLEMTKLEKIRDGGMTYNGKDYRVWNIYPTISFNHVDGGLQQELPRHGFYVADPWL